MTLAFDAATETAVTPSTGSFTHTPVGTPRAVLAFVVDNGATADNLTAVNYGASAMSEISGSPLIKSTGEASYVHAYFLGASIPTGAQTVTTDGSGAVVVSICIITYTGADDTQVEATDTSLQSDSLDDPSATLALGGVESAVAIGFHSGQGAVSSITPLASWTDRAERDWGAATTGYYTYDVVGTTDVTIGYTTATADDVNCFGIAIAELSAGASPSSWLRPDRGLSRRRYRYGYSH